MEVRPATFARRSGLSRGWGRLCGFDTSGIGTMQNNPELPVNRRIYQTNAVPSMLLATEADLTRRFLGNDLKDICDSAADTRFSVLISTAGLPLENRANALRVWRADCVRSIIESSEAAKNFVQHGPPEFVQSVHNGEVSLFDLRDRIEDYIVSAFQGEIAARREVKNGLQKLLRNLIRDVEPKDTDAKGEARWIVVDSQGRIEWFRYEAKADEFGRATGCGYALFALDRIRSRIKAPRAGWAVAAENSANLGLLNSPALGMSSEEIEDMEDQAGPLEDETADKDEAEAAE